MKFTRLLIIFLVAVVLIFYYILGTGYREQRSRKTVLTSEISGATQQLALIPPPPSDLDQRLVAASDNMNMARNSFPSRLNTTRIVNSILELAEETGVKAIPVITQPWSVVNVNGIDYPVFRLSVAIKGSFTQLTDFLSRLETGEPETLVILDLKVERTTGLPGDESNTGLSANEGYTGIGLRVEANLDIAVYARPLIPEYLNEVKE